MSTNLRFVVLHGGDFVHVDDEWKWTGNETTSLLVPSDITKVGLEAKLMEKFHIHPSTQIELKFKVPNMNVPLARIRDDNDLNWYISVHKKTPLYVILRETEVPKGLHTVQDTEMEDPTLVTKEDIDQIILEAQHRWLRPPEIYEILRNYEKIGLTPEPPNRPPSGSLFLFDRNVLRYFRKDGYNWKKKDGKTVKEANEKLKVGGIDALHCYYAHGEEDQNFQRRIYWMLKGRLAYNHIVLVHYRDVQANRTNFNCYRESEVIPDSQKPRENIHNFEVDSSVYSEIRPNSYEGTLQVMGSASLDHADASEFENAESDNYQGQFSANPGASFESITRREKNKNSMDNGLTYHCDLDFQSSENVMDTSTDGFQAINFQPPFSSAQSSVGMMLGQENELPGQVISSAIGKKKAFGRHSNGPRKTTRAWEPHNTIGLNVDDNAKNPALRQPCFDGLDSVDCWMSNLGDVTESQMQPGSGPSWETVGVEGGGDDSGIFAQVPLDNYILAPPLSQDQLFSIDEFSPNWAYAGSEFKVVIKGKFLRSREEVEKYKWACMFGELEVPAEIIADGVLCCRILSQKTGMVPFYVTCSNRLACSEVREFEFRTTDVQEVDIADAGSVISGETVLHMRFGKLLSLGSIQTSVQKGAAENDLCSKISSLLKDDNEWEQMLNLTTQDEFSADRVQDRLLQKLLKEKLYYWLLQKVAEGVKGPNTLDEGGQGVLHFAAALGYDWAIQPTIAAGVSVNFRDANGWAALHWAAYYGRESMVDILISIGASPGALTDPTPEYHSGRTPADLASCNGHEGISYWLETLVNKPMHCTATTKRVRGPKF